MADVNTFRSAFRDFVTREGKVFGKLHPMQLSRELTRFYVKDVLGVLMPGSVPDADDDESIEDAIMDASGDVQVDFLFQQDDRVLIIQTKYHSAGTVESDSEFGNFCDVVHRLHPDLGKKYNKNSRLLDAASDIDWENGNFELHFISLGRGSANIVAREERGQSPVDGLPGIEERVDISFLDETLLNQRYREAITTRGEIDEAVPLILSQTKGEHPWITYRPDTGRVAYIGRISAGQVKQIYGKYKSRLFTLNIRNFIGENATNKQIIDSAKHNAQEFFFFNNGISAVATEIVPDLKAHTLLCKRLSIINGAQTVRSLHKAFRDPKGNPGPAEVLIRVTEVSLKRSATEQGFLAGVTKYNNTQNVIKLSDFRSNDPVQLQLADRWAKETRDGRQFWYKNKRTGDLKQNRIAIGMEDFTKTVFAFREGPADIRGGSSFLFNAEATGGYGLVFGERIGDKRVHVWEALDDDRFRLLAGTWYVCEVVSQEAEKQKAAKKDSTVKGALERKWLVFFTVGELLRAAYAAKGQQAQLNRDLIFLGGKSGWVSEEGNSEVARLRTYARQACAILIEDYTEEREKPGWTSRNWTRSEKTLDRLRRKCEGRAEFVLEAQGLLRTSRQ